MDGVKALLRSLQLPGEKERAASPTRSFLLPRRGVALIKINFLVTLRLSLVSLPTPEKKGRNEKSKIYACKEA